MGARPVVMVCVAVAVPVAARLCAEDPLGELPCDGVGTLDDVAEPVVEPRWLPLTLWLPVAGSEGDDVPLAVGAPLGLCVPLVVGVSVPVVEPRWVPLTLWLPVAEDEEFSHRCRRRSRGRSRRAERWCLAWRRRPALGLGLRATLGLGLGLGLSLGVSEHENDQPKTFPESHPP